VLFYVTASGKHGYHCAIKVNIHTYCESEILCTPHVRHFNRSVCPQLKERLSLDGKVNASLKLADKEFSPGELCTVTGWGATEEVRVSYKIKTFVTQQITVFYNCSILRVENFICLKAYFSKRLVTFIPLFI
jgi:hypothetical protein